MVSSIRYYIPLRAEQEDRIINGIRVVTKSVLLGTFLTAICQGLVGGIAFADPGFPGSFLGNHDCVLPPSSRLWGLISYGSPSRSISFCWVS